MDQENPRSFDQIPDCHCRAGGAASGFLCPAASLAVAGCKVRQRGHAGSPDHGGGYFLQFPRALEIGTAHGGTLLFLTRLASPQATIVSIDLPGGKFGGGYSSRRSWFYQRFALRRQCLYLLRGNSHSNEMLDQVKSAFKDHPVDYLFIDGDHRYEGVKSDFEMYGPMVRKGGLIAFHDIADGPSEFVGGVPEFWREIRARYRYMEFIKDHKQEGLGIGVLYVE